MLFLLIIIYKEIIVFCTGPHAPSEAQDFQKWFSKYSDILFDLGNEILFISGYKFIHDLLKGIHIANISDNQTTYFRFFPPLTI